MRIGRACSVVLSGLEGNVVEAEAQISAGIPNFNIVGIPDAAIKESKERVRAALAYCGINMPQQRITVNLSPASVHKSGTGIDLALTLAVTNALGLTRDFRKSTMCVGELRLDGRLQPVRGILAMAEFARQQGYSCLVVPTGNLEEAQIVPELEIIGVSHLSQLLALLECNTKIHDLPTVKMRVDSTKSEQNHEDIKDLIGHSQARFALEVAASGHHHMLMVGPPGCGKTFLAHTLPGILPPITISEALSVTAIASIAGTYYADGKLLSKRPFQAPHHSVTPSSIIGGGMHCPRPGLVSIAHCGVLFIDEMPEFNPAVLQLIRQPLEIGKITVNRAKFNVVFPAHFQIIGAANPCPCGNWNVLGKSCTCSPKQRIQYLQRIGGPILDRIDIQINMHNPTRAEITANYRNECSAQVQKRVMNARITAQERLKEFGISVNSQITGELLRSSVLKLGKKASALLDRGYDRGLFTLRTLDRISRLSWTVADLAGHVSPTPEDVARALILRYSDQNSVATR